MDFMEIAKSHTI